MSKSLSDAMKEAELETLEWLSNIPPSMSMAEALKDADKLTAKWWSNLPQNERDELSRDNVAAAIYGKRLMAVAAESAKSKPAVPDQKDTKAPTKTVDSAAADPKTPAATPSSATEGKTLVCVTFNVMAHVWACWDKDLDQKELPPYMTRYKTAIATIERGMPLWSSSGVIPEIMHFQEVTTEFRDLVVERFGKDYAISAIQGDPNTSAKNADGTKAVNGVMTVVHKKLGPAFYGPGTRSDSEEQRYQYHDTGAIITWLAHTSCAALFINTHLDRQSNESGRKQLDELMGSVYKLARGGARIVVAADLNQEYVDLKSKTPGVGKFSNLFMPMPARGTGLITCYLPKAKPPMEIDHVVTTHDQLEIVDRWVPTIKPSAGTVLTVNDVITAVGSDHLPVFFVVKAL